MASGPSAVQGADKQLSGDGLLVRTIVPPGGVSHSVSGALLPEDVLRRRLSAIEASPTTSGRNQLVTATDTLIRISAVDENSGALVPLQHLRMRGTVRALAIATYGRLENDVLHVLGDASTIYLLRYSAVDDCVVSTGVAVLSLPPWPTVRLAPRAEAYLLAVHSRRPFGAAASLHSSIAAYCVSGVDDSVRGGHACEVPVSGIVISLAFLEDNEEYSSIAPAYLLALVQRSNKQHIVIFAITGDPDNGDAAPTIRTVASMITCANRSDDVYGARMMRKPSTPPPQRCSRAASAVMAVHGSPFLFVICLEGRVVVADAGPILRTASEGHPVVMYGPGAPGSDKQIVKDASNGYRKQVASGVSIPGSRVQGEDSVSDSPGPSSAPEAGSSAVPEAVGPTSAAPSASNDPPEGGGTASIAVPVNGAVGGAGSASDGNQEVSNSGSQLSGTPVGQSGSVHMSPPGSSGNALSTVQTPGSLSVPAQSGGDPTEGSPPGSMNDTDDWLASSALPSVGGTDSQQDGPAGPSALSSPHGSFSEGPAASTDEPSGQASGGNLHASEEAHVQVVVDNSVHVADVMQDGSSEEPLSSGTQGTPMGLQHILSPAARSSGASSSGAPRIKPVGTTRSPRFPTEKMVILDGFVKLYAEASPEGLSCLHVPPHVAIDLPEGCEVVSGFSTAGSHFRGTAYVDFEDDSPQRGTSSFAFPRTDAMYLVTESGTLFVLSWSQALRRYGTRTYRIPTLDPVDTSGPLSARACVTDAHHPLRKSSLPLFCLERVGLVGSAKCMASLDCSLLFVARVAADSNLYRIVLPSRSRHASSRASSEYELYSRQDFLNVGPISDIALVRPRPQRQYKRLSRFPSTENGRQSRRVGSPSTRGRKGFNETSADVDGNSCSHADSLDGTSCVGDGLVKTSHDSRDHRSISDDFPSREPSLLVCSGIGSSGTVRQLRPGGAVDILSSSPACFPCCTGLWALRSTKSSQHHSFIVMGFPSTSGIYIPAPPSSSGAHDSTVARFIDASPCVGFRLDVQTIACGRIADGVLAQVCGDGVRLVHLLDVDTLPKPFDENTALVSGFLVGSTSDWSPPDSGRISIGCVIDGSLVVAVVSSGLKTRLFHIRIGEKGQAEVVSFQEVESEISSIFVHSAASNPGASTRGLIWDSGLVVASTYAPSIEIRLLHCGLHVLCKTTVDFWKQTFPIRGAQRIGKEPSAGRSCCGSGTLGRLYSQPAGPVCESTHYLELPDRELLVAGLRDGSVLTYEVAVNPGEIRRSSACAANRFLRLIGRRKLGAKPVRVSRVSAAYGVFFLAECERPWLGVVSSHGVEWLPLHFGETQASAPLSLPGAERCLAFVTADDRLHVCGIRRISPVTVSSILVGDTPRRVAQLDSPLSHVVVATSLRDTVIPACSGSILEDEKISSRSKPGAEETPGGCAGVSKAQKLGFKDKRSQRTLVDSGTSGPSADLRVYNVASRALVCRASLLRNEQVHVLLVWGDCVVVGTSLGLRSAYGHHDELCDRGRLLLYAVSFRGGNTGNAQRHARGIRGRAIRHELDLVCQVVLPGAVLAGDVGRYHDVLVVSSNEIIFVFAKSENGSALIEVARLATRMAVVSISVRKSLICAADLRDSVAFYRVDFQARTISRERGDSQKRSVSDCVLVDATTALVADRDGGVCMLTYSARDKELLSQEDPPMRASRLVPANLFGPRAMEEISPVLEDVRDGHVSVLEEQADVDMESEESDEAMESAAANEFVEAENTVSGSDSPSGAASSPPVSGVNVGALSHPSRAQDEPHSGVPSCNGDTSEVDVPQVEHPTNCRETLADSGSTSFREDDPMPGLAESRDGSAELRDAALSEGEVCEQIVVGYDECSSEEETTTEENDADNNLQLPTNPDGGPSSLALLAETVQLQNESSAPVQRHLILSHAVPVNELVLRVRRGFFGRRENVRISPWRHVLKTDSSGDLDAGFWAGNGDVTLLACASGAVLAALPLGPQVVPILRDVAEALLEVPRIRRTTLGIEDTEYQGVGKTRNTLNGDLLVEFCRLSALDQQTVAARAGFPGDDNAKRVSDLIMSVVDRCC